MMLSTSQKEVLNSTLVS